VVVKNNKVWLGRYRAESLVKKYGTPLYVYEADTIKSRYSNLVENIKYSSLKVHYAVKANSNLYLLKLIKKLGAGAETVSLGEVLVSLKAGFKPNQIIYTAATLPKTSSSP